MNVYELIESCHSREQLDAIRADVLSIVESCTSVEEMKRIQEAFCEQKNRIQRGRYRSERGKSDG